MATEDFKNNSKSKTASLKKQMYNMPAEGNLNLEIHGRSAGLRICTSNESVPQVHEETCMLRSALVTTDGDINNHALPCKRSRITTKQDSLVSSVTPSVELRESYFRNTGCPFSQMSPTYPALFNLLDEPSPLGLTLRKTPSLVDLIQMKLSHNDRALSQGSDAEMTDLARRGRKTTGPLIIQQEKLKASNFPALKLKIGTWECISRYEGDLVVKCYYAKKKLVWEVLENGLKSKFEIQWSDIIALRASCPDNEPGILEIKVYRPPLFFKESNPQPRKHTLWEATSDFTGGQATICKLHYLQISQGLLNQHYEKLLQCDSRLKLLSEKSISISESDYSLPYNDNAESHHDWTELQFPQQKGVHYIHFGSERSPSHVKLRTVLGAFESPDTGIVPKHEPVDIVDRVHYRMREITSSPSSSSGIESEGPSHMPFLNLSCRGIYSEGHDSNNHACRSEGFQFLEHINRFDCRDYQGITDISSKPVRAERSLCYPSFGDRDAKQQRFPELAYNLGEALAPPSDDQRISSQFNVSPSQMNAENLSYLLVPTKNFSQAQLGLPLPAEDCSRGECGLMNDVMTSKKSKLPEEMPQTSFQSSVLKVGKHDSFVDLLCNIPRIASLPQFFEPAVVRGSADFKFKSQCMDTEFK